MDFGQLSKKKHKELLGNIAIAPKVKIRDLNDLSVFYTPGIAKVSADIAAAPDKVWEYTMRQNSVAVISDGSAVLGLGNVGPLAAEPVMAGKALLFKELADIDAFPLVLDTQESKEIIATVKNLAPNFGGINLEDISAPRCFEIESALSDLGIPVIHDDQHGTAVVVLAGLINSCRVVGKNLDQSQIVINGAGAAGTAIAKIISDYTKNRADITVLDRDGAIQTGRNRLTEHKLELALLTNRDKKSGGLSEVLPGADIFIGVSAANLLTQEQIKLMAKNPIVFALANPLPEIEPAAAKAAGAAIIATGRSDFPNQVNNVLAFPGLFRGLLDAKAKKASAGVFTAAATALAESLTAPNADNILPSPLDKRVVPIIAKAVSLVVKHENLIRSNS